MSLARLIVATIISIFTAGTGDIGGMSDTCTLPSTPVKETFVIWSYLYLQTVLNLGALQDDDDFYAATTASSEWSRYYTSNSQDVALEKIKEVSDSLTAAKDTQCDRAPESGVCCFLIQYATWAKNAYVLNNQTVHVYGSKCEAEKTVTESGYAKRLSDDWVREMWRWIAAEGNGSPYAYKVATYAAKGICLNPQCGENCVQCEKSNEAGDFFGPPDVMGSYAGLLDSFQSCGPLPPLP